MFRPAQEEPGGARKTPLAPAHQRKFDERYSNVFPASETDEKLTGIGSYHGTTWQWLEHLQMVAACCARSHDMHRSLRVGLVIAT